MFSTARCFVSAHPQPRVTVPCRRAPALTAASARPRRGPRRDRSWDDGGSGDEDGAGDRIDESFFGEAQGEEEPEPEEEEEEQPGRRPLSPAPEPGRQLRGSDVLRALQRAAAAKEAEKKKKKKSAGARPAARRQEKGGGVKPVEEVGEVRPIEIRSEWAPRIRELERRVKQLVDKYHHHQ